MSDAQHRIPDFGLAAEDYARHRQGFPPDFFDRIAVLGCGLPGQRVLDLGTGTGLLARALALRGCDVTGLDPSPALVAQAQRLDAEAGAAVRYVHATAEHTVLPDAAFDLVTAATCWHWFDRPAAAREAHRVLAPGGRLLVCELDWHFTPGSIGERTWQLIDAHRPGGNWPPGGSFQYPAWTADLTRNGFTRWEAFACTTQLHYSAEGWRGRVRASAGVAPAMDAPTLARFDAAMAAMLRDTAGAAATFPVGHKIFALVATRD
jgi:SAM-dependent methyltransferase